MSRDVAWPDTAKERAIRLSAERRLASLRGCAPLLSVLAAAWMPHALEAQLRPAPPWSGPESAPPASIAGIYDRAASPLEFSRGWLGRAEQVRRRRAELSVAGKLDGLSPEAAAEEGAALSGTLRIPVVLVRYADVEAPFEPAVVADRLFGESRGDTLSYSHYWHEVSGGLVTAAGSVTPWIRLPDTAGDYMPAADYGWAKFGRMTGFRGDVLDAADAKLDFGAFDNDGPDGIPNSGDDDGFADFVAFLYATDCAGEWRAGSIWPHRGAMPPRETDDRAAGGGHIKVSDYVILPAVQPRSCRPLDIGVLAHETGHAFGLPDLYDYDGSSAGIGAWGLMGLGSGSSPHSPAHPSAWEKEQLGWVAVDWLAAHGGRVELGPVAAERRVLRYDLPDASGDYLLLENRQRLGSDSSLPGEGLLVWRVEPERGELGAWNSDERRPAVRLIEADGRSDLALGRPADAGDPFTAGAGGGELASAGASAVRLDSVRQDAYGVVRAALSALPDVPPPAPAVAVAAAAQPLTRRVATGLPWSWGIAVSDGRILQASYGWDPLGLRPRPRILELAAGAAFPSTLARLPAEALYSPVADAAGGVYVLARARERNYLYHVGRDGRSRLITDSLSASPAYGAAALPDGSLAVSHWDGRIERVSRQGEVTLLALTRERLYQIATDGRGTLYAATYAGHVLRLAGERIERLPTGFGEGRLVAVAAAPDGGVYAAERGGEGRVLRLDEDGARGIVAQQPGAEFYGLTVFDGALYAHDAGQRALLRIPVAGGGHRVVAAAAP